ncbi:MAG: hypothetical protein ACLPZR_20020 [Solirubrobacteraceae bacterium]
MKATIQPALFTVVGLTTESEIDWTAVVRVRMMKQFAADTPAGHVGETSGVLVCPSVTIEGEAEADAVVLVDVPVDVFVVDVFVLDVFVLDVFVLDVFVLDVLVLEVLVLDVLVLEVLVLDVVVVDVLVVEAEAAAGIMAARAMAMADITSDRRFILVSEHDRAPASCAKRRPAGRRSDLQPRSGPSGPRDDPVPRPRIMACEP